MRCGRQKQDVINSKFVGKIRTEYYPSEKENTVGMDCKSVPKTKIGFRACCVEAERHNIRTLRVVLATIREFKTK
jgi:hypothetical protein